MLQLLTPLNWKDYELIDCGAFEKLERFGDLILARPEPQAVWDKGLMEKEWEKSLDIRFRPRGATTGNWLKKNPSLPDRWHIRYQTGELDLQFRLGLTSFKHVGIFPEQAVNWDFIAASIKKLETPEPKFLNLFAYTGGASLAARQAGADTTHVDSIKQVVTWGNENMALSGLKDIRWVVEDAIKFVKREVRRGKKYQGIILDPPAYGHGPKGEKWKLEDHINEMIGEVASLLDEKEHFLVLNTYSLGFSALIVENLLSTSFPGAEPEVGELYLQAGSGSKLPLGVWGRLSKLNR
ncbi:23S rRNA (cytosine1962-C5)-methyltransferase [Anseongella ginsenosidimutans]|uniref:23S rRNA (Cytosine1962-C5)-methyltransferase n=1 Tax=Anseongella ginsenosidimutans TaxID=496056 RepID=A0A4R3KNX5_9SPHI|nr:class I SAM-dependent methyltransferase [Anseongella ginsenosidimutans]QEC53876.1 oxidoreductase [Anseongella ginsenosidimutans]TCS86258.1 23S rRNA (cytosine1962-C5)-methyltransferase [Anseongella ginsenosidimutans]